MKKIDLLEKGLEEDKEYFKKQIEKGIEKLVGKRTKEYVKHCFHCKIWKKADKFIEEVNHQLIN